MEADGRSFGGSQADIGDAILARKDAPASYHLSCVVDDAASGVTMVVRGADLRASTPVQRLLQQLLGLPEPTYLHHALVTHLDGRRLAKRDLARLSPPCAKRAPTDPRWSASFLRAICRLAFGFRKPKERGDNPLLLILLLLAMAATAYVLVRGVIAMASGKDVTGEQQQNYMRKRVLFQAAAIVIVVLILLVAGKSH